MLRTLFVFALALACPARAAADAHACAGRATPRWTARTLLGFQLVPIGAEVQARGGACFPLVPPGGDWLDLAALEVGALTYVSPVYAQGGAYASLTPMDLLNVRLEALGVGYWPLPVEGEPAIGYHGLDSVGAARGEEDGTAAGGFTLRAVTTFQAHIPLDRLALLVYDAFTLEYTELGSAPYFVNLALDQTQRRDDGVLGNDVGLVVELPTAGPSIRLGGFDSYRRVLATGFEQNQVGVLLVAGWSAPIPEMHWMEIGLRLVRFTHHPLHEGELSLTAWWLVEWDLGAV